MTMFDDECQKVLGMNADEAYELEVWEREREKERERERERE